MSLKIRSAYLVLVFAMTAVFHVAGADDPQARLGNAVAVLNRLTESSGHGIQPQQIAKADCGAVIRGFKNGAAGVGVGFGRGFISRRKGENWSAPGAVTLETASLGVQIGGEKIDIVILLLDKEARSKLLSDRFTIDSDASAAWGNGKSVHGDPNAKFMFFGRPRGAFAGFGLDDATLKADDSGNKAVYGKSVTNKEIVNGSADTPAAAQPLIAKLAEETSR